MSGAAAKGPLVGNPPYNPGFCRVEVQVSMFDKLAKVIEHLPVAVYLCEAPTGVIRLYNRRAAGLWGREPPLGDTDERFCGSFKLHRLDGTPLPHSETPMAAVLRDGKPRTDEVVIERPDGSRISVEVNITPLQNDEGRLIGAVNAFTDVSHRESSERALRLSEARYRAIVEDQLDMVCRFLLDGTITFANSTYARYFGLRPSEIAGRRHAALIHPEDRARVDAALAGLSPETPMIVTENRVVRGDGEIRSTRWTNQALYDGQGRVQ
jgi:PAS domain S-box-containing protein